MKKLVLITMLAMMVAPVMASPSLHFTSLLVDSWKLTRTGVGTFTLSFNTDSMNVDISSPAVDPVLLDWINLPSFSVSGIVDNPSGFPYPYASGVLTTSGNLTIKSDTDGLVKYTGSVGSGYMVDIYTDYLALAIPSDDLDVVSYIPGYSAVVDGFGTSDAMGLSLDLNFAGASTSNIYAFVVGSGPVGTFITGTNAGAMAVIPAPGAILLGSIGISIVGWMRRRRTL